MTGEGRQNYARRAAALVSPEFFFSPGLSPPNPSQAHRVTSTAPTGVAVTVSPTQAG